MSQDELWMVNLHRREDGKWSYAAYTTGHALFRTNKGLDSIEDCLTEIGTEMQLDEVARSEAALRARGATGSAQRTPAARSAGMGSKARVRRQTRKR